MADNFDERSRTFVDWFAGRRTTLSQKIQLADLRQNNAGRGIVALTDIEADEELFSIDRKDILSVENSELSEDATGQKIIADLDDPWLSLILVMIHEYLKGQRSAWKPYFDILPSRYDTLMFWSEQELEWLQASAVRGKIGKAGADQTFAEKILRPIRAHSALFSNASDLNDDGLLELAHYMGSTIMAYAFDLEKEPSRQEEDEEGYISDEEDGLLPKGMVPMADMLNADADKNNARLFYGESTVTMKALVPIKAGEEIFNDYGPLPRADLLRRYGYVTPNYSQYDVVEISTPLILDHFRARGMTAVSAEQRVDYLDEYEIYEDGYDIQWPLEDDNLLPEALRILISVFHLSEDKFKALSGKKPKYVFEHILPADILSHYVAILEARMKQYSTSIEDDRKLLGDLQAQPFDVSTYRQKMAVTVRLGEKDLLLEAHQKVSLALSTLQQASKVPNGAQKRQAPDNTADGQKKRKFR